jgi:hypothetical protein
MKYGIRHHLASNLPVRDSFIAFRNRRKLTGVDSDLVLSKKINLGKPLCVGRLGGEESRYLGALSKNYSKKFIVRQLVQSTLTKRRSNVSKLAGFYFSSKLEEEMFYELYLECLKETDVLGIWGTAFAWFESKGLTGSTTAINLGATSPWVEPYPYSTNFKKGLLPWTLALEGKKVLVISPFSRSITEQYKHHKDLFIGANLPIFELQTITSPMTFSGYETGGISWFDNLNIMKSKMEDKVFDIALIGCGAYSFPLAAHAKNLGKQGVHCGGGLQLFFGITGNRWQKSLYVSKYLNDRWVYPSASETPIGHSFIENSSYWKLD